MKNLFVGLLMFAGTLFAVANNGEEDKKGKVQETAIVSVQESKVVRNLDDFCSITIITTTTVTDCDGTTVHVSSQTGTGTTLRWP